MHISKRDATVIGLLFVINVNSLPTTDLTTSSLLSKRAFSYDAENCGKIYGGMTAQKWLDQSWPMVEKLATAGQDGLDKVRKVLENQAGITKEQETGIEEGEWEKLGPLYSVLFGKIEKEDPNTGKADPKFAAEAKEHIERIKIMSKALGRLKVFDGKRKPNIKLHCDDDWLKDKNPTTKKAYDGKTELKTGYKWLFNTDAGAWKQYPNPGRPCVGERAAVTFTGKLNQKHPESYVSLCNRRGLDR